MQDCQGMEFTTAQPLVNLQHTSPLLVIVYSTVLASILLLLVAKTVKTGKGKKLPPGNLGLPLIGETLQFLSARRTHKTDEWVAEKVVKYGPVFKTSIMGSPTVVLTGQAGNRFLFQNDCNAIVIKQPKSVLKIRGEKNMLALSGEYHKRMRGAVMQFLKPEALKKFVGRMDSIIKQHFLHCWEGKESVTVLPLLKKVTFTMACDLLSSLKESQETEILSENFAAASKGILSLPLNLYGTSFHGGLKARSRICKQLSGYLEVRRKELQEAKSSPDQDLLSYMLSLRDNNNKALTKEEILDNISLVIAAGHDTTCSLLVHIVRMLALNPNIYENVFQEQMEVEAGKRPDEPLKWEDIQKMKYTWRVAQETLRMYSPVFGGFREAVKDIEYGGYMIPKGWQILWLIGVTHMNEEIFKEPHRFDPSHFEKHVPPYNFIPFGGGPRICPGYEFAKMETLIYLHHLVLKYKWSLVNPNEKLICEPVVLLPEMGLPIKLQARRRIS